MSSALKHAELSKLARNISTKNMFHIALELLGLDDEEWDNLEKAYESTRLNFKVLRQWTMKDSQNTRHVSTFYIVFFTVRF